MISSHGYVVVLADGRRVYLKSTIDDTAGKMAEEIEVVRL